MFLFNPIKSIICCGNPKDKYCLMLISLYCSRWLHTIQYENTREGRQDMFRDRDLKLKQR